MGRLTPNYPGVDVYARTMNSAAHHMYIIHCTLLKILHPQVNLYTCIYVMSVSHTMFHIYNHSLTVYIAVKPCPQYCRLTNITAIIMRRRGRWSHVHSSLIFLIFLAQHVFFHSLGIKYRGKK